MTIPVVYLDEGELDDAIQNGRLCAIRSEDSLSPDWEDEEDEIVAALEDVIYKKYGEESAFVSNNIWLARQLGADFSASILDRDLILFLLDFLDSRAKLHCVTSGIYNCLNISSPGAGKTYLGRIVLNLKEIAVESTLKSLWDERVGDVVLQ